MRLRFAAPYREAPDTRIIRRFCKDDSTLERAAETSAQSEAMSEPNYKQYQSIRRGVVRLALRNWLSPTSIW